MLQRASLLRRSLHALHNEQRSILRSYATRSGLQEERTKKVVEEIKHLKYALESNMKQRSASMEKIDEHDIAAVYKEVSAPMPIRPKINDNFLEKLRIKFLDTRQLEGSNTKLLTSALDENSQEFQQPMMVADDSQSKQIDKTTVEDFEQLIYANSLAKNPSEAERAFDLMQTFNHNPTVRSINHLMDAYANVNNLEHVLSIYRKLESFGLEADIYTYAIVIKAFVEAKRLDDAFIIFEHLKKNSIVPNQPIFSNLISGCIKANKIQKAWDIFDTMRLTYHQPDEVSFTLMLHACAKTGEVEKALNLFEDMIQSQLYPTDVTFNVLINACAKRPDYFTEAFNLLEQMQTHYGFQPDKITYNTLLMACARKKDLGRARQLFQKMWNDAEQKGSHSLLIPDSWSYTNLFWSYASYHPKFSPKQKKNVSPDSAALSVERRSLLSSPPPSRHSTVCKEAHQLFKHMVASNVPITTPVLISYLALHISHNQSVEKCMSIYNGLFDKYNVQKNAYLFKSMLDLSYKKKDGQLAWKVWEDYQDFLESRERSFLTENEAVSVQKSKEAEKHAAALSEGWTDEQQKSIAILMANTLARSNDLKNAISILSSEVRRSNLSPPRLSELRPFYNKCIQLEDEEVKARLLQLCTKDPKKRPISLKYKRVNTTLELD